MSLEDRARSQLAAAQSEANPEYVRQMLLATPAQYEDVPFLAELQDIITKYQVPSVGIYRRGRRGYSAFGLGNPFYVYELTGRGWVIETRDHGDQIGDTEFAWTTDGRVFRKTHWLEQGSNDRGIAAQDYINGHAHEEGEFLALMHVRAQLVDGWEATMTSAATAIVAGCRTGVITI